MPVTVPRPATVDAPAAVARGLPERTAAAGVVAVASTVGALLLGYVIAWNPRTVHLSVSLDATGLGLLLGGIAACGLALRYPAAGLCLLVGFLYLNLSQVLLRLHEVPSLLQLLIVPLLIAAWAERRRDGRSRTALPPALTVLLTGYVMVLLASTMWARDPVLAGARTFDGFKSLVLFCAVVFLASSAGRIRRAAYVLVGAGALLAGLGVFQTLSGSFANEFGGLARVKYAHIYGDVFDPRIAGPLGDPNYFAQILLALVPVALAAGWGARRLSGRIAAFAAAGLLMVGTVLTYSRGGAVALGLVLLLSLLAHGVRSGRIVGGLLLVCLLLPFVPDEFSQRLTTLGQILPGGESVLDPDSSFGKRRVVTAVAWRMFVDRPLVGVGVGNYGVRFPEYVEEVGSVAREYESDRANYAHSLYLEIAAETGLLGLLTFGLVVAACFAGLRRARVAFRAAGRPDLADLARGVEIGLIGYLVSSIFLHGHHIRYLWLFFALAAALERVSRVSGAGDGEARACTA